MKPKDQYTGENEKWFEFFKKTVIRRDEDGEPYLIRWTIFSLYKWFSIKYHKILLSDDLCSHDHPWPFITFILKGGYMEWTPEEANDSGDYIKNRIGVDGTKEVCHYHNAGSVMYRPANWRHQLELEKITGDEYKINGNITKTKSNGDLIPTHTLVLTFAQKRDWGFFTKSGWKFWKDYSKAKHC